MANTISAGKINVQKLDDVYVHDTFLSVRYDLSGDHEASGFRYVPISKIVHVISSPLAGHDLLRVEVLNLEKDELYRFHVERGKGGILVQQIHEAKVALAHAWLDRMKEEDGRQICSLDSEAINLLRKMANNPGTKEYVEKLRGFTPKEFLLMSEAFYAGQACEAEANGVIHDYDSLEDFLDHEVNGQTQAERLRKEKGW